jgi:hypothetical protein
VKLEHNMSNEKIKTYKNPARVKTLDYKPYVPQYQLLGVEPGEYKSAVVPENTPIAVPKEAAQRARKVGLQQPYAEAAPSPVGRGKGPIPNVGNNVEHSWSGVDEEIIDDLDESKLDPNHPMVDNNDYVSASALGLSEEEMPMLDEVQNPPPKRFVGDPKRFMGEISPAQIMAAAIYSETSPEEDLFPILRDLEEGSYLLIVSGVPVCSGPKEEIEEQTRSFIFGEHEMCDGNPISDEEIIVLKKSAIKIGAFLE